MTSKTHGFRACEEQALATPPSGKPQNIYDDPRFFEGYRNLRRNDTGLNGALEVPALRALLPDLQGAHVLDLGCGFGDFARYARSMGAASVTALDVSEKMIAEATRLSSDDKITFVRSAIEDFASRPGDFDLVVSSMALHYVQELQPVVTRIFDSLNPGGRLIFSVEHPVCTASPQGWFRDGNNKALHWPVDRYQDEGERSTSWFVDGVVKFHRTVQTYVSTLIASGFRLDHLGEPRPESAYLDARPSLVETLRRPPVLLLSAMKP